jgi:hypothetical protein
VVVGSVLWICDSQKVSESRGNDSIRHLKFRLWVTHYRSQEEAHRFWVLTFGNMRITFVIRTNVQAIWLPFGTLWTGKKSAHDTKPLWNKRLYQLLKKKYYLLP